MASVHLSGPQVASAAVAKPSSLDGLHLLPSLACRGGGGSGAPREGRHGCVAQGDSCWPRAIGRGWQQEALVDHSWKQRDVLSMQEVSSRVRTAIILFSGYPT